MPALPLTFQKTTIYHLKKIFLTSDNKNTSSSKMRRVKTVVLAQYSQIIGKEFMLQSLLFPLVSRGDGGGET
jgi:hypothetical protein